MPPSPRFRDLLLVLSYSLGADAFAFLLHLFVSWEFVIKCDIWNWLIKVERSLFFGVALGPHPRSSDGSVEHLGTMLGIGSGSCFGFYFSA